MSDLLIRGKPIAEVDDETIIKSIAMTQKTVDRMINETRYVVDANMLWHYQGVLHNLETEIERRNL